MTTSKNTTTLKKTQSLGLPLVHKDLGISKRTEAEQEAGGAKVGYALCIRKHLQNWRQGTVSVKGRADVAYTNHKPWRQKGTGRARAGSRRSPLWRGGGVIFGPQPRTRTLKVTRKQRQLVMQEIINQYVENNRIIMMDWQIDGLRPSTKAAADVLKRLELSNYKVNMFVQPGDIVTQASFNNIGSVSVLLFDELNVYDLTGADYWILKKSDLDAFKSMVARWI
jgi:large subunit ribosomal protein L4